MLKRLLIAAPFAVVAFVAGMIMRDADATAVTAGPPTSSLTLSGDVSAANATFTGNVGISGTLGVTGAATLRGGLTEIGAVAISGAIAATGTVGITGSVNPIFTIASTNSGGACLIASGITSGWAIQSTVTSGDAYRGTATSGRAYFGTSNNAAGQAVYAENTSTGNALTASGQVGFTSASVTAGTTQTQAGATQLSATFNRVTTGNANDGVALPQGLAGLRCTIVANISANALKVYPHNSDNDTINGGSADASVTLSASKETWFCTSDGTAWISGAL